MSTEDNCEKPDDMCTLTTYNNIISMAVINIWHVKQHITQDDFCIKSDVIL